MPDTVIVPYNYLIVKNQNGLWKYREKVQGFININIYDKVASLFLKQQLYLKCVCLFKMVVLNTYFISK